MKSPSGVGMICEYLGLDALGRVGDSQAEPDELLRGGRVGRHDPGPAQADILEAGGHAAELAGTGPPAEPGAVHDGPVPGRAPALLDDAGPRSSTKNESR